MTSGFDPKILDSFPLQEDATQEVIKLDGLGAALALCAYGILQDKLEFGMIDPRSGKDVTGIEELRNSLESLQEAHTFNTRLFIQSVEVYAHKAAEQEFNSALVRHANAINRGSAMIFDEESQQSTWLDIPKRMRNKFLDNLSGIEIPKTDSNDQTDAEDEPVISNTPEIVRIVTQSLAEKIKPVYLAIPTKEEAVKGNIPGVVIEKVMHDSSGGMVFGTRLVPDSKILKSLSRKVREFREWVDEFVENPEDATAKIFINSGLDIVKQWGQDLADGLVMERNAALIESLDPSDLKEVNEHNQPEAPKLTKRQKRRAKQLAQLAAQQSEAIEIVEIEESSKIDTLEDVSISLPWIDDGQARTINVDSYTANGQAVYVVHGIDSKLQDITDKTLGKDELENKIYKAIWHQAKLISSGIMPWDPKNDTSRPINKNGKAPRDYQDETIWYTYDLRPNAPRVYFIVKDASEIESSDTPQLKTDAKCIIVAAVTDKQNQLDVLKRFTGKSRADLIAGGAGAI